MSMFPHTVTLYSVSTETNPDTFAEETKSYITILEGVLLSATKGQNVSETGLQTADAVMLYIPKGVKATDGVSGEKKQYVGTVEFWRAEDKSKLWTLSPESNSFFVKGVAVHPDWSAQKIEAAYDHVYNITTVDFMDYGSGLDHWEVGGA